VLYQVATPYTAGFARPNNGYAGFPLDSERDLYDVDKADIVPSGVAELARLRQS
jgi:hypothetical protein